MIAPDDDIVTHLPITLRPDPARVVIKPFEPAEAPPGFDTKDSPRAQRIVERILSLEAPDLTGELARVCESLSTRYRSTDDILMRRFDDVNGVIFRHCDIPRDRALLIGAYFSEEYAFEAAALFNPSIVPHPDQKDVPSGSVRFILSLRGVGEGHLSSVTFRTGLFAADGTLIVDPPSLLATVPRIETIVDGQPDDPAVRLFCDASRDLS